MRLLIVSGLAVVALMCVGLVPRKLVSSATTGPATALWSRRCRTRRLQGVSCHISRFSRGLIDRLAKGNWFVDPSNSSIACRQTGAVTVGDINTGASGEEVFSQRLITKTATAGAAM